MVRFHIPSLILFGPGKIYHMKWLIFIGQKLFEDDIFIYQMLNILLVGQLLADS